ncbi:MAG TPA: antibiotic biosynthesis monooxygenase [Chloroflexota bacterium]
MSKLAIIRRIHLLPGREEAGIRWLYETAPMRRQAGQLSQLLLKGQIDPHEYQWVQIWADDRAYAAWRASPDRSRLAAERGRYMTHEPTRMYDLLE